MTTVNIRDVPVSFPFQPYPIQKEYMYDVLECLQNKTNGVLESPSGTGKTLSLLCSTLAWLQLKKTQKKEQRKRKVCNVSEDSNLENINSQHNIAGKPINLQNISKMPSVIYASPTHFHSSQAMQEMKKTAYNQMKSIVLASRDKLCIHPDIENMDNNGVKDVMCRFKQKTKCCKFNNLEQNKMNSSVTDINLMDIEDIVKLGRHKEFCPFYVTQELKEKADIMFMPYNYLLNPSIRKNLGINLANTVVILDEAHNVEKMFEESASLQLKSLDIASAIKEVNTVMEFLSKKAIEYDESQIDLNADDLCKLKEMFLKLETEIDNIKLNSDKNKGLSLDGTFFCKLLKKAGINFDNYFTFQKVISNVILYMATINDSSFAAKGNNLQMFENIFDIIFSGQFPDCESQINKCYKVFIQEEQVKKRPGNSLTNLIFTKTGGKVINYWCFSPEFVINMFIKNGLRSLIITSKTLAPLQPLISLLEIPIEVRLENYHIISNDQFCVKIIPMGPDLEVLNGNYQNRNNSKYINSLGMSILNIVTIVPDGVLIFFPFYSFMLKCQKVWQKSGIWGNISNQKAIFVEPEDNISFISAMRKYYQKIKDPENKGAIFMGVCRGKVSEDLDFVDSNARTVLITGLPYPTFKDPKIIFKKQYLNKCNKEDKRYLKGQEWYNLDASRVVNQIIGRVIRHKDDYGANLLLDKRFSSQEMKNQMSLWIRNKIQTVRHFGEVITDLKLFFKTAEANHKDSMVNKEEVIHSRTSSQPSKKIKLMDAPNSSNKQRTIITFSRRISSSGSYYYCK